MKKVEAELKTSVEREKKTSEKIRALEQEKMCMSSSEEAAKRAGEEKRVLEVRIRELEAGLRSAISRESMSSEKIQALERQKMCQSSAEEAAKRAGEEKRVLEARIRKLEADLRLAVEKMTIALEKVRVFEHEKNCKSSSSSNGQSNRVDLLNQNTSDRDVIQVEYFVLNHNMLTTIAI